MNLITDPFYFRLGAIFGGLGVAMGAFGAHGLKSRVTDVKLLDTWDTAAKYQLIHSLALLLVPKQPQRKSINWTGFCFTAGIMIFSGSLYLLVLTGKKWLGAITPIGGLCMIAGWVFLALSR